MSSKEIQRYCMQRVIQLYKNCATQHIAFFHDQSPNILFLTTKYDELTDSTTSCWFYTKQLLSLAIPTRGFPQTEWVLAKMGNGQSATTASLSSSATQQFQRYDWNVEEFQNFVRLQQWDRATTFYTCGWIQMDTHKESIPESMINVGIQSLIAFQNSSDFRLKFTKTGKLAGSLKRNDEQMIYFATHILFVFFHYGTRALEIPRHHSESKMVILRMLESWLEQLCLDENQFWINLELALEVAICILLLTKDQTTNRNGNDHVLEIAKRLKTYKRHAKDGYLVFPKQNNQVYGKTYYVHADYHTHFLIAFFFAHLSFIVS